MVAAGSEDRALRVDVSIREERVALLLNAGVSPTEFARYVLEVIPLGEWVENFKSAAQPERTSVRSSSRLSRTWSSSSHSLRKSTQDPRESPDAVTFLADRQEPWSEDSFRSYLDVVAVTKDFDEPMFLLAAYNSLGPSPSGSELQRECQFTNERVWQEKLRVAKTRLTVQARKVGHSPIFPRPQTTDAGRLHPISPTLYPLLKKWFEARRDEVPTPGDWGRNVEREAPKKGK
jgi:hypothetical protein